MKSSNAFVTGALAWLALMAPVAAQDLPADQKDDQEQADEDWKKAEEQQGEEKGPGQHGLDGNPLEEILKLMEQVENRLVEAETGEFTQEEQKRIVEAMRFEDKTSAALEELIQQVEKQQQESQSSGGQDQQQKKQQKQQDKQQQKSEEQQQREKEQERQRQAQQQKQEQKQEPQQDQRTEDRQRQQEGRPPEAEGGDLNDPSRAAGRWGTLPSKLHQDAANSSNRPPPGRWGRLIQRYRQRLAESED